MSYNNIPSELHRLHFLVLTAKDNFQKRVYQSQLNNYIENHVTPTIELVLYCEDLIRVPDEL